ncbi:MAG: hypothetical protein HY906_04815, partial [Deltaproteobacteria bacterium]|nr:hypothetical protein [Deltaproteobacteria bacterium]
MEDFIFTPIVFLVGLGIHQVVLKRHTAAEGQLLTIGFFGHVVSSAVQVLLVTYYYTYGGDLLVYFRNAVPIAEAMRLDFAGIAPEVAKTFLHWEANLPFEVYGGATSGSMTAAAAFVLFGVGNSVYAASLVFGLASYLSQVMLYHALRPEFRAERHRDVLVGATLLPSAVFWSSTMLKEPLIMAALGPMLLALRWLAEGRRRAASVALRVPTAVVMAMVKPYVLMALSVAAAVVYVW